MSKAYDWVEWAFLEAIMQHLGLEERMIRIIMSCLKSMSYSIILNGQPVGIIKPLRGFWQGDPLPPYLFLLYTMGLQGLLQNAEVEGSNKGVAISKNGPRVSHLFFLLMIVSFSTVLLRLNVKRFWIFWLFMKGGQVKKLIANRLIFFSVQIPYNQPKLVSNIFWELAIWQYDKYLGLPVLVGREKKGALYTLRKERGRNYKVGRKSCYP